MVPTTPTRTIDDLVGSLAEAFSTAGRELYLVGGTVRDQLLGRRHKDIDLTTNATPDEVRSFLSSTEPTAVYDVGARFGTIAATYDLDEGSIPVEITTYRSEAYDRGSRKPRVEYGISLVDDLARRDFTINAIAQAPGIDELIDPFGGRRDLEARVIRAVGRATDRFAEDPLRMLRAVRLAVELGFTIEPATAGAIFRRAGELGTISRERVAEEFNRVLCSPEPARGLRTLSELGLLRRIVPEVAALRESTAGRRTKDVFEHTLRVVENTESDLVLRWAALLHDVGKPRTMIVENGEIHFPGHERVGESMARNILSSLRMDSTTTETVARLVGMHMRTNQYEPEWTDGAVRRLMREAGDDLPRLMRLSEADVTSYRPHKIAAAKARVDALRARCERIAEAEDIAALKSPLDGNDLMTMFDRKPGPWIRPIKDYLLDLVLDGALSSDDRDRAVELAREFVAAHPE